MARKLYLLKEKKIRYKNKEYTLKETTNGRFFVWIPKYALGDKEVHYHPGGSAKDYESDEAWHAAWDKQKKISQANKLKGRCVELGGQNYKSILEREKETEKFLEPNKKHLTSDGKNPHKVQIYEGTPEENAKKRYEHKDNKAPYNWGALMSSWGVQTPWRIPTMLEKSDHFYDKDGNEIEYDREFFESIQQNISTAKRALKELEELIRDNCKDMSLFEEYEHMTDAQEIRRLTNSLRLEFYFEENAKRMQKEIKELLPKGRGGILKNDVNYSLKYNTNRKKVEFSAYKHLH